MLCVHYSTGCKLCRVSFIALLLSSARLPHTVQAVLLPGNPSVTCQHRVWPEVHALPGHKLGSEAGCGASVGCSDQHLGPGAHRCGNCLPGEVVGTLLCILPGQLSIMLRRWGKTMKRVLSPDNMAPFAEAFTKAAQHLVAGSLLVSVTAQAAALLQPCCCKQFCSHQCSTSSAGMVSLCSLQYCPFTRSMQTQVSIVITMKSGVGGANKAWLIQGHSVLCSPPPVVLLAHDSRKL